MSVLWTSEEIADATGGTASAAFEVTGVTFDSREVGPGDLFIAMPGTVHDGHEFVPQAIASHAAGLIVSRPVNHPHVLVGDTAKALQDLGRASRERSGATIIGVTGSVGKTSTKEAIYAALDRWQPGKVHRSVKSYNNHTGVPLSLARMPRETAYAVLEMGMNAKGEIAALTRLVRPNVAVVTAIAPAHIENLGSEEAIADAKAEIFEGLEADGVAIIPNDSPHRDRLVRAARRHADRIVTFGTGDADVHALHAVRADNGGSLITASLLDSDVTFTISQRGEHWVSNALAVLAVVEAIGGDAALAGLALADLGGIKGRGERHQIRVDGGEALLIDESYNANPASMAATLKSLGEEVGAERRIAVLGPMRELGEHADQLHADLAPSVIAAKVDELVLVGADMRPLEQALDGQVHVTNVADAAQAADALSRLLRPGDAVLVKASNSVGLGRVVDRLTKGMAECST
ncbi:UDP-N-acetylmuramoyl-tripeptide--D-alanyl-D-alanine ligase [Sphingomonas sp. RG327]|uniref:UDP-N-acetylmuramoyl-tripeptide--D-alanyl-D-alanine ligase n=1 Tax=Sphingomonas anseongensis TaxID=2908207 RepID=A0ABT0RF04_9SPHN|nr:UDP-N-acetylmuramoyl-tripeptide--D-alanyl-D-alanine ligase [Sphingomonas anseongensis]MCL6678857.1 UDP-N-acetylmuramoyl-tripeptide--D-alanyl-D-alanine ligase [Sphingomonas anseongensis]